MLFCYGCPTADEKVAAPGDGRKVMTDLLDLAAMRRRESMPPASAAAGDPQARCPRGDSPARNRGGLAALALAVATLGVLPSPDTAAQRPSDPFQSAAPPEAAALPTAGERPEPRRSEGAAPSDPSPAPTPAHRPGTPSSRHAEPRRQPADPSFDLVNHSGRTIDEIYVSPSSDATWGPDLLGRDVLPNGQARRIPRAAGQDCVNDIRVVYAGGAADERRRVDTCALASVAFGSSPGQPQQTRGDPSFTLVNNSGQAVSAVYVSPSSDTSWGADRLGQGVLPAGRAFAVRLPEGECLHDIRAVYADGSAQERRRVDTCGLTSLVLP